MQTEDFAEKSSVNQTHSKPKRKAQEDAEECPQRASIGRSRWSCPSALHEVRKRRPRRNGARLDASHRFAPLGARNPVLDVDLHLVLTTQQASMPAQRVKSAGHGKFSRADSIGERLGLPKFDGVPGRAVKRKERPPQPRGVSGAPAPLGAASRAFWAPRQLLDVSELSEWGQKAARRQVFGSDRVHTAREPRHLSLKMSLYRATEWASSMGGEAIYLGGFSPEILGLA